MSKYSIPNNTDGMWVYFDDGHSEYWNNTRIQGELNYRGLEFLKTQIQLKTKLIFDDIWALVHSTMSQTDLEKIRAEYWREGK